jgi:hypothetical protein
MTRRQQFLTGLFLGIGLVLPGCGKGGGNVIVTGVVTLDGKPLEGAQVSFVPEQEGLPTGGATTDKEGTFEITPKGYRNALAPGSYTVTINKIDPAKVNKDLERLRAKGIDPDKPEMQMLFTPGIGPLANKANIAPKRVRDKEHSMLKKIELRAGVNNLPPFELMSR